MYGVGNGAHTRHDPDEHDALNGPREAADPLNPDGVTNGDVALHGEARDSQDGSVGRHLDQE